jgi:hypothetical protein
MESATTKVRVYVKHRGDRLTLTAIPDPRAAYSLTKQGDGMWLCDYPIAVGLPDGAWVMSRAEWIGVGRRQFEIEYARQ